jgi:hypothetical protein
MIGSSLPLCYPQIGASHLLYPRAHVPCLPLDKTYPTGGSHPAKKGEYYTQASFIKAATSPPPCVEFVETTSRYSGKVHRDFPPRG